MGLTEMVFFTKSIDSQQQEAFAVRSALTYRIPCVQEQARAFL